MIFVMQKAHGLQLQRNKSNHAGNVIQKEFRAYSLIHMNLRQSASLMHIKKAASADQKRL